MIFFYAQIHFIGNFMQSSIFVTISEFIIFSMSFVRKTKFLEVVRILVNLPMAHYSTSNLFSIYYSSNSLDYNNYT